MSGKRLPAGLYDRLVTRRLEELLEGVEHAVREGIEGEEAHLYLIRWLAGELGAALQVAGRGSLPERQAELANAVVALAARRLGEASPADTVSLPLEALREVARRGAGGDVVHLPQPLIPLDQSDLLINARGEPSLLPVLLSEIASANRIDLLCAFVKFHGVRLIEGELERFVARGGRLRVITTTYIGATERRAVDRLLDIGAEVKVSYLAKATRLHPKAWLFHRESGYSTAYIGSSNLSKAALTDGLEWNVRLTETDAGHLLEKFRSSFEGYWRDDHFVAYDPSARPEDAVALDRALAAARGGDPGAGLELEIAHLDVEPWPHQREILERLDAERRRHGRWRNLVVAATGTGKTVVAALDYRRLHRDRTLGPRPSLLFVAHRKEILQQSLLTFRQVLRDGSFGELYVDGERPDRWRWVFASIQSLSRLDLETALDPDHFQVVVVDEFHHSAAPTYDRLLVHLDPAVLLGLTATPERADGQSVTHWFGDRIAAELRLWDALDEGLLVPFHYFAVHDNTDLSRLQWRRGGYDLGELENLYTGDHKRVALVLEELGRKVADPNAMRALGFCVSVRHAEFMRDQFEAAGLRAALVTGTTPRDEREETIAKIRAGELHVVFTVDVFNEGIDLPEIDTVLFLRPTESATVFLQQLGRGLRRTDEKSCLTVLDFVGTARREFRYDLRYRALTGASRRELVDEIGLGFPTLPAGCSISLDRVSRQIVLDNLKSSLGARFATYVEELRRLGDVPLSTFLGELLLEPGDLYRNPSWSWTRVRREAGMQPLAGREGEGEERLLRGVGRLTHLDDPERLALLGRLLASDLAPAAGSLSEREKRIVLGWLSLLWGGLAKAPRRLEARLAELWRQPAVRDEVAELLDVLEDRSTTLPVPLDEVVGWEHSIPLSVHSVYSLDEVLTAFGMMSFEKPHRIREGVAWEEATGSDLFFVTLEKTAKHYSPKTLYRDYALSDRLFHWESQHVTSEGSETGQRYIHHEERGTHVLLFARRGKKEGGRTAPYLFLGPARYVEHEGERPMAITWELVRPLPAEFLIAARLAAAG